MRTVSLRTRFSSSALPPEGTHTASPKAISRRTSYYRVRLEFLSYPQLITACCTARVFGPPPDFRRGSSWPWVDNPVSGALDATRPSTALRTNLNIVEGCSPVKTRFPYGYSPEGINLATPNNSQAHSSIGTPSPTLRVGNS